MFDKSVMALRMLAKYLVKHATICEEEKAIEIITEIRKKNNDTLVGLKKVEILRSAKEMHKTMKQKKRESGSSEDDDSDSDDDTDTLVDCDVEKVNDKTKLKKESL